MKLIIDIPDNEIPKRQEILSIDLHFIDGKVCECAYPFEELDIPKMCEECHSQSYLNGFDAGYELGKNDRRLLTIGEQKEAENDGKV